MELYEKNQGALLPVAATQRFLNGVSPQECAKRHLRAHNNLHFDQKRDLQQNEQQKLQIFS